MTERPIFFSGPMVRAILDGRKTQTRRIAIPKRSCIDFIGGGPKDDPDWNDPSCWGFEDPNTGFWWTLRGNEECHQLPCPQGKPGDRLWVRETWNWEKNAIGSKRDEDGPFAYAASPTHGSSIDGKWHPSIHMPRFASRITLEITGVRAERLQSISDADAEAEGVDFLRHVPNADETLNARGLFRCLWDGLNATRGHGWDANPWVWVVEFRHIG
ncbi:hypothetical protein [Burkholderia sp. Bp9099]|uniref:hypothetical protein n=1 Tax=Burkholderia sp. Bp9099 TaxID=2184568 RepID=UPI000F5F1D8E|nr:hypothetical protein [Burkholderia sp. Bp9099]RQZ50896.1 hypothetical protein DIE17_03725 [Burkholderia sp. Bp9099]